MRITVLVVLVAGLAFARPGPNTANFLKLVKEPVFGLSLKTLPSCPASFELTLAREMPDPGWKLAIDNFERKEGRVVVFATGTRAEGDWPAVMTPRAAQARIGRFRKGPHVLEIHYRADPKAKYKLVQVALLRGG